MVLKNILFLFIILSGSLQAQMFSVGGESDTQRRGGSSNYFKIGYTAVDFSFKGNSNLVIEQNRLDFNTPAITIGFDSPSLYASLSFINKFTGAEDERYLKFSINYINRLAFVRKRSFQLGVPLSLNSNLVSVQNEQQNNDFGQTVFGIGLGAFTSVTIPEKLILFIEGVPSYGFSNSNGGLFGGSNKSIIARARLNFLSVFPSRNLSLGYDYKLSSYDLDDDEFDYDLTYHLITLGISF